jgi:Right handed beta helix region
MRMQLKNAAFLITILALACTSGAARARTWYVEKDGSGDWFSIQAGVEAAADGDTILIGPGQYSELHPAPYSDVIAYWDTPKELFIFGAGQDLTIIGPEAYYETSDGTFGLNNSSNSALHLKDLSFVNLQFGVMSHGESIWVSNCRSAECTEGIWIENAIAGSVSDCSFILERRELGPQGVQLRATQNVIVESCDFHNMQVYLHGTSDSVVRNCTFSNTWQGVAATYFTSGGVFEFNEVAGGGVFASDAGHVEIRDNVFGYNPIDGYNINVSGRFPEVEIHRNVFHGGFYSTIYLRTWASITGSENHILRGAGGYSVTLQYYSDAFSSNIDLRNNYWGTSDPDSIAAMILDGNDDPEIEQTVQFEPFSAVPLPAEKPSLGSFKSLFR